MQTLLSWSSGKDSAWALHLLRQQPDVDVVGLVTTVNAAFDRVAMHGVRRTLVEAQAEAAGLPLPQFRVESVGRIFASILADLLPKLFRAHLPPRNSNDGKIRREQSFLGQIV